MERAGHSDRSKDGDGGLEVPYEVDSRGFGKMHVDMGESRAQTS